MPLHTFKCDCGIEFERFQKINELKETEPCPSCLMPAQKKWSGVPQGAHTWRVFVHEHLGPEPIEITSKRQLKEECKKREVYCHGL